MKDQTNQAVAQDVKNHFWKYFLPLLFVGLINNNGYVLVGTKAQELAKEFGQANFMAAFQFFLIFFNLFIRVFNMKFFIKLKHTTRIIINTGVLMAAYTIIAVASNYHTFTAFVFALIASALMGGGSCFGESTVLGYLKGYPSEVVLGWSSGTGFAGVFGAGISILIKLKLSTFYLCIGCLPLCILYLICFMYIVYKKNKLVNGEAQTEESANLLKTNIADEAKANDNLNWVNIKAVLPKICYFCANLATVYFLEYNIMTAFGDYTTKQLIIKKNSDSFVVENAYMFICLFYQIGVVISRSSLKVIKVSQTHILTILQYVNWCLWLLEAINFKLGAHSVQSYYVLFAHMVFVGLMGGCSYVNTMYLILSSKELNINQKELALNMTTFFDDIGITISSVLSIVFASLMK